MLRSRRPTTVQPKRSTPPGSRIYAVGDVHGRLDLLDALLEAILAESRGRSPRPVLIMLGDYVDRGPSSRGVIQRLVELERSPALETQFIRGNHDYEMARFSVDPAAGPMWCRHGGTETLRSYGLSPPPPIDDAESWRRVQQDFHNAVPGQHLLFLERLKAYVEYGDFFFTHAGVRPGVELEDQNDNDLMWIRQEFLKDDTLLGKTIVHGHTPEQDAVVSLRRIGLDTGAYATGKLTAVVLEGLQTRLMQTSAFRGNLTVQHLACTVN